MTNSAFKTLTELKNNQTVIKVCFGEPVVANAGFMKQIKTPIAAGYLQKLIFNPQFIKQ